jgi:HPt (histidine-containing phosphotransfer) domain-containing protein
MHRTEDLPEQADSGIDFRAALAMAGGDVELLRDLAGAFLDEVPKLLRSLRIAVGQRDSESLQAAAHQLQGVMRCLHVEHALEQAQQLELLGEGETDWPTAENMLAEASATITSATDRLIEFLGEQR